MDQTTQVDLLDEILGLRAEKSAYLDESVTYSPASRYLDQDRFQLEQQNFSVVIHCWWPMSAN